MTDTALGRQTTGSVRPSVPRPARRPFAGSTSAQYRTDGTRLREKSCAATYDTLHCWEPS
jgi:hypothetical protein